MRSPRSWRRRLSGCGLRLVALALVGAAIWFWLWRVDPRGYLPLTVKTAEVIRFDDDWGIREGCWFALFKLHSDTIDGFKRDGLRFLGGDTHPRYESAGNPYGSWLETPLDPSTAGLSEKDGRQRARMRWVHKMGVYTASTFPISTFRNLSRIQAATTQSQETVRD